MPSPRALGQAKASISPSFSHLLEIPFSNTWHIWWTDYRCIRNHTHPILLIRCWRTLSISKRNARLHTYIGKKLSLGSWTLRRFNTLTQSRKVVAVKSESLELFASHGSNTCDAIDMIKIFRKIVISKCQIWIVKVSLNYIKGYSLLCNKGNHHGGVDLI